MKVEVNAVGEGAAEFMDRMHRLLAREYRRHMVTQTVVGKIATMEADIDMKAPEREVRDGILGGPRRPFEVRKP